MWGDTTLQALLRKTCLLVRITRYAGKPFLPILIPDARTVRHYSLQNEMVWLTQAQIVTLFNSTKSNISEHIKHIYTDKELEKESTVRFFRTVQQESKRARTVY
jgi:hypothetical protein